MPTPGRALLTAGRAMQYPPAAPAAIAIPRSIRPGAVRDRISWGRLSGVIAPPAIVATR